MDETLNLNGCFHFQQKSFLALGQPPTSKFQCSGYNASSMDHVLSFDCRI